MLNNIFEAMEPRVQDAAGSPLDTWLATPEPIELFKRFPMQGAVWRVLLVLRDTGDEVLALTCYDDMGPHTRCAPVQVQLIAKATLY